MQDQTQSYTDNGHNSRNVHRSAHLGGHHCDRHGHGDHSRNAHTDNRSQQPRPRRRLPLRSRPRPTRPQAATMRTPTVSLAVMCVWLSACGGGERIAGGGRRGVSKADGAMERRDDRKRAARRGRVAARLRWRRARSRWWMRWHSNGGRGNAGRHANDGRVSWAARLPRTSWRKRGGATTVVRVPQWHQQRMSDNAGKPDRMT